MNSYKCVQCDLVNFANQQLCKRCQSPNPYLNSPAQAAGFSPPPQFNYVAQPLPDFSTPPPPNVFGTAAGTTTVDGFSQFPPPAFANRPPAFANNGINTICGMCGSQSNSMKELYNDDVCRRCHRQYISRRQAAFLLDLLIYRGLATFALIWSTKIIGESLAPFLFMFSFVPILLKDGTKGVSIGKLVAGLKTIDFTTKEPCGIGKSILRNIILYVPFMLIIELIFIQNGKRLGDRMVNTRVVWNKYEKARVFWT